ncbi:hypothetical protein EIN_354610 [Entamoeba invadens IP1]|uniref:Uncharacterized protein n=1 Tax=Entamoeba invadens IP1 TaxID=370355 RepID=L7FLP2_ENTIV|nr:hypothetical protein EIN_354610 [Entamoeba invadens IP1]ELP87159.1 hypothetical protein EIN_354610 [Entamoeba invadens IP1]|eukprot:XP_004253930.1 hypothetical protein EIN_354610 [Entamoeba invadens IP1]
MAKRPEKSEPKKKLTKEEQQIQNNITDFTRKSKIIEDIFGLKEQNCITYFSSSISKEKASKYNTFLYLTETAICFQYFLKDKKTELPYVIYYDDIDTLEKTKIISLTDTKKQSFTFDIDKSILDSAFFIISYLRDFPFMRMNKELAKVDIDILDTSINFDRDDESGENTLHLQMAESANKYADATLDLKKSTINMINQQRDMLFEAESALNETDAYFPEIEQNLKCVESLSSELKMRYCKKKVVKPKPLKRPLEIQAEVLIFDPQVLTVEVLVMEKDNVYFPASFKMYDDTIVITEIVPEGVTKKKVFMKFINIGQIYKIKMIYKPFHLEIGIDDFKRTKVTVFTTLIQLIVNEIYMKHSRVYMTKKEGEKLKVMTNPQPVLKVEFEENSKGFDFGESAISEVFMVSGAVEGKGKFESEHAEALKSFTDIRERAKYKRMLLTNSKTVEILQEITKANKQIIKLEEDLSQTIDRVQEKTDEQGKRLAAASRQVDSANRVYSKK